MILGISRCAFHAPCATTPAAPPAWPRPKGRPVESVTDADNVESKTLTLGTYRVAQHP